MDVSSDHPVDGRIRRWSVGIGDERRCHCHRQDVERGEATRAEAEFGFLADMIVPVFSPFRRRQMAEAMPHDHPIAPTMPKMVRPTWAMNAAVSVIRRMLSAATAVLTRASSRDSHASA